MVDYIKLPDDPQKMEELRRWETECTRCGLLWEEVLSAHPLRGTCPRCRFDPNKGYQVEET
jgi:ribosomal protein S27AE